MSKFVVQFRSVPNPDFGERRAPARPQRFTADDFPVISAAARAYIEAGDLGGGNWPEIRILEAATGDHVATVSYNGRVWPPVPWHSGLKPLFDPQA